MPPRTRIEFDFSRLPIVLVRQPEVASVDAIDEWYDVVSRLIVEYPNPIALIHDVRPIDFRTVRADQRVAVARAMQRLEAIPEVTKIVSDCRIVSNPAMVAAVRAVNWLHGHSPWARGTFANETDAVEWSMAQLAHRAREARDLPSGDY